MKFKEENIRPKKLINIARRYFYQDINYLIRNKKNFIKSNCPACNLNNKNFLFSKNSFKYYTCNNCKTFYITPRPSNNLLNKFYQNSKLYKYWNNYIFPTTENVRREKIFKPRVKKIISIAKKYKLKKNAIMDVGAGYGTFCDVMKRKNFFKKVIALEPNIDGAKKCIEKKIETFNLSIEKIKPRYLKDVNVVTSFEVIEHMANPLKFLKKIYKVLSKNTIIVFTCPNGKGFDISTLKKKSDTIDHEHLNYFNPVSAKILAERCGFKILEVTTPGILDIDIVYNKFLTKKYSTKNEFFIEILKNEILRNNFQKFLIENNLSSNMWVVAQKK